MGATATACTRALRATGAVAVLGLVLIGLPTLLVNVIGWPLPHHLPSMDEIRMWLAIWPDDHAILDVVAVLGWIVWANLVRHTLIAVIDAVAEHAHYRRTGQRPPPPNPRHPSPVRAAAAVLVGAIASSLLLDAAHASTHHHTTASATRPSPPGHEPATEPASTQASGSHHECAGAQHVPARPAITRVTPVDTSTPNSPHRTYVVVEHDTLWDIAATHLGDPMRWRGIYVANRFRPQPDGYRLTDPGLLHVGWHLQLPDTAQQPAPTSPNQSRHNTAERAAPSHSPSSHRPGHHHAAARHAPAAEPTTGTQHPPDRHNRTARSDEADGVTMPSGSWLTVGLAAALATTALAVSLRRRKLQQLSWPRTARPATTPPIVPASLTTAVTIGHSTLRQQRLAATCEPTVADLHHDQPDRAAVDAAFGIDRHGTEHGLAEITHHGIGLTGPGALAAVRAAIAAATTGDPRAPDRAVQVITSRPLLARLLDDESPIASDGVTGDRLQILDSDQEALNRWEAEILHRRRLLDHSDTDTDTDTDTDSNAYDTPEPIDAPAGTGTAILIAAAEANEPARVHADLTAHSDLGIGILLLGAAPNLPQLHINTDGTTHLEHTPEATPAAITTLRRVCTLTATELADAFRLVHATATTEDAVDPDRTQSAEAGEDRGSAQPTPETPAPRAPTPPVQLSLLGPPAIAVYGKPAPVAITGIRYAILAYLAAHPHGVTRDDILHAIYPDLPADTASTRFRQACTATRAALREAADNPDGRYIINRNDRYHLDPTDITTDLWQMLTELHAATTATDETAALDALRRAVTHYTGDFAPDVDHPWADQYATTYRTQIITALARIAEIEETDHPDTAITALQHALTLDPYAEELYQRIIRIQGRLDRPDAVRRTLNQCTEVLAAINAEPSDTTHRIADRQLRSRQPSAQRPTATPPLSEHHHQAPEATKSAPRSLAQQAPESGAS